MKKRNGIIIQGEKESQWKWIDQETQHVILVVTRTSSPPMLNNKFFNDLLDSIEDKTSLGPKMDSLFTVDVKGIFLDDKNGNVGSVFIDLFFLKDTKKYENLNKIILEALKILDHIVVDYDEHGMNLSVEFLPKKANFYSDNWNYRCGREYEKAK